MLQFAKSGEEIAADKAIICTGAWSGELLRPLGINPHIYPVRGYSVTLPPGESAPNVSVTALKQRIVFSRINGSVRIAGFADFTGFSTSADRERIAALMEVAGRYAPEAADYAADEQYGWGGFRPMTPDGRHALGVRLSIICFSTPGTACSAGPWLLLRAMTSLRQSTNHFNKRVQICFDACYCWQWALPFWPPALSVRHSRQPNPAKQTASH